MSSPTVWSRATALAERTPETRNRYVDFLRAASITWTATVLVNATIMTLYLWHLTAMVLVIGLAHLLGDVGLHPRPGTWSWWATRPM